MGRPPQGPFKNKRKVFSTRITDKLREEIETASNISGRSISQEVEFRLERTFIEDYERNKNDNT